MTQSRKRVGGKLTKSAYRARSLQDLEPMRDFFERVMEALATVTTIRTVHFYIQPLLLANGLGVREDGALCLWNSGAFTYRSHSSYSHRTIPTALRMLGIEPGDPDRWEMLQGLILEACEQELARFKERLAAPYEKRFRAALAGK